MTGKGYKMSKEHKEKIGSKNKGRKLPLRTAEHCEKIRQSRLGKTGNSKGKHWKHTKKSRQNISEGIKKIVLSGKHNFWKGGVTKQNKLIRSSFEYKLWRIAVFERDDWTCRFCGVKGGKLQADHIKPFCIYPELRFAIDNGRTLCVDCHKTTDTYGSRALEFNRLNKNNGRQK